MNILDANIGSAKDNMSSPVHNWYKFTAGFCDTEEVVVSDEIFNRLNDDGNLVFIHPDSI